MPQKKSISVAGINIQWPWSELILKRKKDIETRTYPIPEKYRGVWMALIETPGPDGKKNGVKKARVTALIRFSESFKYRSADHWRRDRRRHQVDTSDPHYKFSASRPKFGWIVRDLIPLSEPFSKIDEKHRGIIYASRCKLPKTLLPKRAIQRFFSK